jgi:hypothetical protein
VNTQEEYRDLERRACEILEKEYRKRRRKDRNSLPSNMRWQRSTTIDFASIESGQRATISS